MNDTMIDFKSFRVEAVSSCDEHTIVLSEVQLIILRFGTLQRSEMLLVYNQKIVSSPTLLPPSLLTRSPKQRSKFVTHSPC